MQRHGQTDTERQTEVQSRIIIHWSSMEIKKVRGGRGTKRQTETQTCKDTDRQRHRQTNRDQTAVQSSVVGHWSWKLKR